MFLLYHAYVYLEFLILACTIYILAPEAIQVKAKGLGKIGYVANSPFTVKGESMSAGRLYDKIGDKAKGKVIFVVDGGVVCRITDIEMNKPLKEMDKEL